jgi:hypothetical protein
VLAAVISPHVSTPPTHLWAKRITGNAIPQFPLSARAVVNVQTTANTSAAVIDIAHAAPTASILQLICVRIC